MDEAIINQDVQEGVFRDEDMTKALQDVKQLEKDEVPIYFTNDELRRFFLAIPETKQRDAVFFLVLLGTGRRVSEILGITKNDLDFQNRLLRITTLKKRKKRVDAIRLPKEVAYQLSLLTGSLKAEDKVFGITRQYADQLCKKYAEIAGITGKRTSCHVFRHTFAVRWLEQGKDIRTLQKHLGHSFITTTMVYLRIVDKEYYKTVDDLDIMGFMKDG